MSGHDWARLKDNYLGATRITISGRAGRADEKEAQPNQDQAQGQARTGPGKKAGIVLWGDH